VETGKQEDGHPDMPAHNTVPFPHIFYVKLLQVIMAFGTLMFTRRCVRGRLLYSQEQKQTNKERENEQKTRGRLAGFLFVDG